MSTTTVWTLIAALAAATVALKAAGPLVTGRTLPPRLASVVALMPPALLSALVVTGTLTDDGGDIAAGADAIGVLAASVVVWRSGSVLRGVMVALGVTAVLRAVT